jgi:dTDP-4-amino-4,6-dideoxygalactose transaminase
VDYYGQPADLAPIREIADRHGLLVVADSAQAHGATYRGRRVGSLAHASCFSFYPSKNLGALGDAGAVTTDDPAIAEHMRELRDHGRGSDRDEYVRIGQNARLDALQAAVLRVKLAHLDGANALRRQAADWYASLLAGSELDLPTAAPDATHVYHLYVVRHPERDAIRLALADLGIDARVHYPHPVHLIPVFDRYRPPSGSLPATEALAAECLSLPLFPGITQDELSRVASAVRHVTNQ